MSDGKKGIEMRKDSNQVLLDAAQLLNEKLEITAIMRQLVICAIELTGTSWGAYGLVKNNKMVFTEYLGEGKVIDICYEFEKGHGVPGWMLEHKKPYLSNDTEHDAIVIPEVRESFGFYNLVDIPISSRNGELIGCIEVHNTIDCRDFTNDDIDKLMTLGNMAALAIENAKLIEEMTQAQKAIAHRLEFEELISRFSTDFINLELDKIDIGIENALKLLAEFFCVDRSYIFQYSDNRQSMSNTHEWCRNGIESTKYRLQNLNVRDLAWFDQQMQRLEIVQIDSLNELPDEAAAEKIEWQQREKILSIVCVPMVCRGQLKGFVGLDSVLYEVPWEKDVVTLLRVVGEMFANALDRKRSQELIRRSEERFRSLVETTSDFIWEVDANGVYTYASPQIKKLLGYEPEELLGKTPLNFMKTEEAQKIRAQFELIQHSKHTFSNLENVNRHKDGHEVVVETSGVPIIDSEGKLRGYRGIDRDITDRKHFQQQLQTLNKELDSKNKELETILYAAAHDLRSPLVNISGFSFEFERCYEEMSGLIEKNYAGGTSEISKMRETLRDSLNFVTSSVAKMDSLLLGLLKVSRLGQVSRSVELVDMNSIMSDVVKSLEPQFKSLEASVEIDTLPPCRADSLQVMQIFQNLLTNAVKYREVSRHLVIKVTGSSNGNENIYCVEDNGKGIKKQHQAQIFNIFYRLEPEETFGEGLGLTIVRRLAEINNGKVWVESEYGEWSKFFVSLPAK